MSLLIGLRLRRRSAETLEPTLEVGLRLRDDVERHVGVLKAAELSALPPEDAGLVGLKPDRGDVSGNQIAFPLEVRRPKAMNDVARRDFQDDGTIDRKVKLVGRHGAAARYRVLVGDLPPPLMPGDLDRDRAQRMERRDRATSPHTGDEQTNEDRDGRTHRDGDAARQTSVGSRRPLARGAAEAAHERGDDEAYCEDEDDHRHPQHQRPEIMDGR